ncbi:MAG TPA: hypothetical protein PKB06_09305, partial [Actinotalea sp.]|nr:hypothetical protein [Actinotalea sp.]
MPSRPGHGPARRAPRRARLARAAVVLAVLTAAAVAAGYPGYVRPAVDDEQVSAQLPVDAIVALGGLRDTVPHAYDLAASGAAPVLVVSDPYEESTITYIGRLCGGAIAPVDGPEVVCF